jgi:2'-5' RNA ligase
MRLFVAINLPADVREALHAAAAPLREHDAPVQWVAPEAIHLTLKFLGEVEPEREDAITAALASVAGGRRAFPLPVGGFGAFPSRTRPRVFWVGTEAVPALELLQHDLERTFADLGFPLEGRPFRPHLTLGRTHKGAERQARTVGELLDDVAFEDTVTVESVELMQSRLSPRGASYRARHSARLGDG